MKIKVRMLLFSMCLSLVLWNCTDTFWFTEGNIEVEHENFTLQEAREFFNESTMRLAIVSRSMQDDGKTRLSAGEFTPDWNNSVASAKNDLMCYDVPIDCEHTYKAVMLTKESTTATLDAVDVYQKLVIVKSRTTGKIGQYLLTLVPDIEYERQHQGKVADLFINAGDKGGFSGVVIYSIPGLDLIVRVNRYTTGIKTKGIYLSGDKKEMKEKIFRLKSILRPFQLYRMPDAQSRTVAGEAEILQWAMRPGCRVEQAGYSYYLMDELGRLQHIMLDTDKDGTPDTHTDYCCGYNDPTSEEDACPYCWQSGCDRTCIMPDGSITDALVTAEYLTQVAETTVTDVSNIYGTEIACCNFGVQMFFRTLFNDNSLDGKVANQMVQYWNGNPDQWEPILMSEAQDYANQGYFVVAGWENPSGASGHVVVVVPGEEEYSSSWGEYVPVVMDTGGGMRNPKQSISISFGRNKKNQIVYFKYK